MDSTHAPNCEEPTARVPAFVMGGTAGAIDPIADLLRMAEEGAGFAQAMVIGTGQDGQPIVVHARPGCPPDIPTSWIPALVEALANPRERAPIATRISEPASGTLVTVGTSQPGAERLVLCAWSPGPDRSTDQSLALLASLANAIATSITRDRHHRLAEASFQVLLDHVREAIAVVSPEGVLLFASPATLRMLGYDQIPDMANSLEGTQLASLIHPDDWPLVTRLSAQLLASPDRPQTAEYRVQHADGSWRWLSSHATNLIADPSIGGFIFSTVDITDQKRQQARLEYEATHDFMTGIANRASLERSLDRRLSAGEQVSLLYIDLDGFHGINSAYGHAAGDGVLREIAHRLDQHRRQGEIVSRFGGDEFLILIPTADEKTANRRAQGFLNCFKDACRIGERLIPVRASIGISRAPHDGDDLRSLYRAADRALYRIKDGTSGRIATYDERLDGHLGIAATLAEEFLAAASARELTLFVQPVRDLATRAVVSYEGLLRWNHPLLGLLTPQEILPAVEEFGYGDLLAKVCVDQAIAAIQHLKTPVAINLSANQLHHPELAVEIIAAVRASAIDPAMLGIEVTEAATVASHDEGMLTLRTLHEFGIRIAIDDFGTGYSDLAALRTYPVDTLKIDRSFIAPLDGEVRDYALVTAILTIASAFDLDVIAEGIENEHQLEAVATLGCRYGQGYLLGRPRPLEPDEQGPTE